MATAEALVEESDAGFFVAELENVLNVEANGALLKLTRQGQLSREQITGRYLYCSQEPAKRKLQVRARRVLEAGSFPAGRIPHTDVAAIAEPQEALAGGDAALVAIERIMMGAVHVALAEKAFTEALAYAKQREQLGRHPGRDADVSRWLWMLVAIDAVPKASPPSGLHPPPTDAGQKRDTRRQHQRSPRLGHGGRREDFISVEREVGGEGGVAVERAHVEELRGEAGGRVHDAGQLPGLALLREDRAA